MYEKRTYFKKLSNGRKVMGRAFCMAVVGARFQIFMRKYGLTDEESLACWVSDSPRKQVEYFGSVEKAKEIAEVGFAKYNGPIPFLDGDAL